MKLLQKTARWHEGDARLTNGALCALGLTLVMLTHQFVAELTHFRIGFSGVSMLSVLVYVGAVLVVRTQPVDRWTLPIVIGFAVAMHAITYLCDPTLSSDIYRYVWDGLVQHAGVNPYRYVPGNAALSYLRAPNQDIFDNINRRDYAPTIYPPVAQMIYWLATYFAPSVEAMKLMMLAFECLAGAALVKILRRLGRPSAEVLLLIWCPLLVWEIGQAGHVDAVVCGFVSLALLFRLRQQPVLTGLFLGCAVMTKFYPLLLFPALYQRRDWKMPATVLAVCVTGYALYASVGMRVFGFLSGYSKEEGIDSGSRFFLLDYVHSLPAFANVPKGAFLVFCALVLGGLTLWAWRYATVEVIVGTMPALPGGVLPAPVFVRAGAMLSFALMLLFSPHYAWYNVWLVPFMVVAPSLPLFTYVLGFFYAYTTGLATPGPKMFLLNERLYLAVAVSFALHFVCRRFPVWQSLLSTQRDGRSTTVIAATQEHVTRPLAQA